VIRNSSICLLAFAGAALSAGSASAGSIPFKSETFPLERNLAFELDGYSAYLASGGGSLTNKIDYAPPESRKRFYGPKDTGATIASHSPLLTPSIRSAACPSGSRRAGDVGFIL